MNREAQPLSLNPESIFPKPEVLQPGSRILFISDFADENWNQDHGKKPLISGIKTFSEKITSMLYDQGYEVDFIHPYITEQATEKRVFRTTPVPFYKTVEIPSSNPHRVYNKIMEQIKKKPDGVFIATVEGVLGIATMLACSHLDIPFTAAVTTNFAEYFSTYIAKSTHNLLKINPKAPQAIANILYKRAAHILVPTPTMQERFREQGFPNTTVWPRGVDTDMFRPREIEDKNPYEQFDWFRENPLPILLYAGRVGADKNIPDFLNMTEQQIFELTKQKFHKVVIGDGPQLEEYERKFAGEYVHFLGVYPHNEVAPFYRFARLFIFPSTKDTFGNVVVESAASGTPVLAYSGDDGGYKIGSQDCVLDGKNGAKVSYGTPLIQGLPEALAINRQVASESTVEEFSWDKTFKIFIENIDPINWKENRKHPRKWNRN